MEVKISSIARAVKQFAFRAVDNPLYVCNDSAMRNRSRKQKDANELAHAMVEMISSGEVPTTLDGKNPIAVAMGRLGGLKGGKARAATMSPEQRSESAKKAALARWASKARADNAED